MRSLPRRSVSWIVRAPRGIGSVVSQHARLEVETVGRQFSDSVRRDRAREVDWLAASASEWKVSDARQRVEYREHQVVKLLMTKDWLLLRFGAARPTSTTKRAPAHKVWMLGGVGFGVAKVAVDQRM